MVFLTLVFVALLSRRARGRLCRHYGDNLLLTGVAFLNICTYLGAECVRENESSRA